MMKIMQKIRTSYKRDKETAQLLLLVHNLQIISILLSLQAMSLSSDFIKIIIVFFEVYTSYVTLLYINFGFLLCISLMLLVIFIQRCLVNYVPKFKNISEQIFKIVGYFILTFRYVCYLPILCLNLIAFQRTQTFLIGKLLCTFNISVAVLISLFDIYMNWSNRYLQTDYCNKRDDSLISFLLYTGFIISFNTFDKIMGVYLVISLGFWNILNLLLTVEYQNIQLISFRFSFLYLFFGINILTDSLDTNKQKNMQLIVMIYKTLIAIFLSGLVTKKIILAIIKSNFKKLSFLKPEFQIQELQQKSSINNIDNVQNIQEQNIMRRSAYSVEGYNSIPQAQSQKEIKLFNSGDNKRVILNGIVILANLFYSLRVRNKDIPKETFIFEWEKVWQKINLIVLSHHIGCQKSDCKCKKKKRNEKIKYETTWILKKLQKLLNKAQNYSNNDFKLNIMKIYTHVQLNSKPLKGYYEIMRMKKMNLTMTNKIDIESLLSETRQCFDRLFLQNDVTNSIIPLYSVFEAEELIQKIKNLLKQCTDVGISFFELFCHGNVKVSQIRKVSSDLIEIKKQISGHLQEIVIKYPEIKQAQLLIFLFYQYFEPYCSRQKEFKRIYHQKSIKKRMLQKYDLQIFKEDYGVIYIDLGGSQKGKIKKVTKKVCQFYNNKTEQMISSNIRQFMPKIYSVFHDRFLNNFIQFGKINILKSRDRLLFGKNKMKFIFPLNATIKTQHLFNDEFGVTGLISKYNSNSEYLMATKTGVLLETSAILFDKIFTEALNKDVDKINRFNIFRIIPDLLRIVKQEQYSKKPSKIHEGLLIFSQFPSLFYDKFRNKKLQDNNQISKSVMSFSYKSQFKSRDSSYQRTQVQIGNDFVNYLFKQFLIQLPIFKLSALKIQFKVSPLRTSEFQILLIEILSTVRINFPYKQIIDQYKPILDNIDSAQDVQMIDKNFNQALSTINKQGCNNLPINSDLNQLNTQRRYSNKQRRMSMDMIRKTSKQFIEQLKQDEQMREDNIEFDNRSDNSSVTDITGGQLKKQTLINGFNSTGGFIKRNILIFMILSSGLALIAGIVIFMKLMIDFKQIIVLEEQNKSIINITTLYQYRVSCIQISQFLSTQNQRQLSEITQDIYQSLNTRFTQLMKIIPEFYLHQNINQKTIELDDLIEQQNDNVQLFQLFHKVEYAFLNMNQIDIEYLRSNYVNVHQDMQKYIQNLTKNIHNILIPKKNIFICLYCCYEVFLILLVFGFILSIRQYDAQEKKIVAMLSTNSPKQIQKAKSRLQLIKNTIKFQNLQQEHNKLISRQCEMMVQDNEGTKQNIQRNLKIIFDEKDRYAVSSKLTIFLLIMFLILFSALFSFYCIIQFNQINQLEKANQAMKQFHFLIIKPSILVNIYLSNVNRAISGQPLTNFSEQLYQQVSSEYFELTNFLASESEYTFLSLLSNDNQRKWYSSKVCEISKNLCSSDTQIKQSYLVEYHILQLKNKLNFLGPQKLLLDSSPHQTINKWHTQTNISQLLPWIFHIEEYSNQEANNYFENHLNQMIESNKKTIIISFSIIFPIYIIMMAVVFYKFIKYTKNIIRQAEIIFIHFPFHVLAQNTYINSYFIDKTKKSQ